MTTFDASQGSILPEQLVASIESGRVLSNEEPLKVPDNSVIELTPRDSVLVVPVTLPTKSLSICVPKTASLGDLKRAVSTSEVCILSGPTTDHIF